MTERGQAGGPGNHVLGVVNDPRTDTLATDLRSAGFSDFAVMTEEDIANEGDIVAGQANPVMRLFGELKDHLNEATQYLERYEDAARDGSPVIAVQVGDEDQAARAGDVLHRNHALDVRYFAGGAVKELAPNSNPSGVPDRAP